MALLFVFSTILKQHAEDFIDFYIYGNFRTKVNIRIRGN